MEDQLTFVRSQLYAFGILDRADIEMAIAVGSKRRIKKGEILVEEGTICQEAGLILSGFFRSFYMNQDAEEITYCFTFRGEFATAYASFISGTPSNETIQAMSDGELFILTKAQINQFEQQSQNWLKLTKTLAELEYMRMEKRLLSLLNNNARERYLDLLKQYPEYLQLIPLHQLASYLGVTQRHLSRIRKQVMN